VHGGGDLGDGDWGTSGLVVGVSAPPVAMIMMRSTPPATDARTARRIPSSPVTSPPMKWQCPPGEVNGGPAATISGPLPGSAANDSRNATAKNARSPRSRTVIIPAARAVAAFTRVPCSNASSEAPCR
jgi:hypothetical protein